MWVYIIHYSFIFFFWFFYLHLLLLLLLLSASSWGRLPFLAGEVGWIFPIWWWYRVHVWGLQWRFCCVCVIATVLTKDKSPHTGYTCTHWVGSFTPTPTPPPTPTTTNNNTNNNTNATTTTSSRGHQVGGTSIRLFRRPIESHAMIFLVSRLDSLAGVASWN